MTPLLNQRPFRHRTESRPRPFPPVWRFASSLLALALAAPAVSLRAQITTPTQEFGFHIGADYHLATFKQLHVYWEKLARESDRMALDTIGYTEEGRAQPMAILTSPANHRRLEHYRSLSKRLAWAEGLTEEDARSLAAGGKAVVWIDGGLHATETLSAQQLIEFVYRMVSGDDAETLRILDDVIVLAVHANPDGHALVAEWYMRHSTPEERSLSGIPVLYQKYAGHDNNRDFYMANLAETVNMNRTMYREWFPQIVYNHHQSSPAGTIMFAPPFRDPPNHNLDPLVLTSLDQVGSAMHHRFVQEGKGGTVTRSGAGFSTWWNGGLRTTPYYHNMIGLLTETWGSPNPSEVPFIPARQLPHGDLPLPVEPGPWSLRQSVEYEMTANWAVLDYASRHRDQLLFNIWRMGMNSIERGSRDHWTVLPSMIDEAVEALREEDGTRRRGTVDDYHRLLKDPAKRDPRGYILSSAQPDFLTAVKFVNVLLKGGVRVHRATTSFEVDGRLHPAGSLIVKAAQAFRPQVLDMFEPQDHPNDFAYPGAPPTPPYDAAGWTLALQMGVEFDRILNGFEGPFVEIEDLAAPPPGRVTAAAGAPGFLLRRDVNDAFIAVNRLLREGEEAYWLTEAVQAKGTGYASGTFFIPATPESRAIIDGLAAELGLDFAGVSEWPAADAMKLTRPRIGLFDRYGGDMRSGWTRFILEAFEFDFELVFAPALDQGGLNDRYDVLIFNGSAIPSPGRDFPARPPSAEIPPEYRDRIGSITEKRTIPQLLDFIRGGGTAIAIGGSTNLARHAGLPLDDHLVDSAGDPLRSEHYYVPGSVLSIRVDRDRPIAHGTGERTAILFGRDPVFSLPPASQDSGLRQVGWFDGEDPLLSGWAWGQEYLRGGVVVIEADFGLGNLFLFAPNITYRGQSHGTFPFLFNGILYGSAEKKRQEPP